jgi:hypothetical protein
MQWPWIYSDWIVFLQWYCIVLLIKYYPPLGKYFQTNEDDSHLSENVFI